MKKFIKYEWRCIKRIIMTPIFMVYVMFFCAFWFFDYFLWVCRGEYHPNYREEYEQNTYVGLFMDMIMQWAEA